MKTFVATMCAVVVFGGVSVAADEPLRAEKPSVDRGYQLSVSFEKNLAVLRPDSGVPEELIASIIEALKEAGHEKFAFKQSVATEKAPARDALWMRIRVQNEVAELDLARNLPYKTVAEVIDHLRESDINKIRFAPPRKGE